MDKSDQIFETNSSCNSQKYITAYKEKFCTQNQQTQDGEVCKNIKAYIEMKNSSYYGDPHECQNSCAEPGEGCKACTNKKYFQCEKVYISSFCVKSFYK